MTGHSGTAVGVVALIFSFLVAADHWLHPLATLLSFIALLLGIVVHIRDLRKK